MGAAAPGLEPLLVTPAERDLMLRLLRRKHVFGGGIVGRVDTDTVSITAAPAGKKTTAGSSSLLIPVQVVKTGGSAGSAASQCTFVYSLYTPMTYGTQGATPFATNVPMYCGRTSVGQYDAPTNGTLGVAMMVVSGGTTTWYLMACQEVPHIKTCACS